MRLGQVQRKRISGSRSLFLVESRTVCLIPPAMGCNYMCQVLCPGEAHWCLRTQGFYWRLVMQACTAWHVPKLQTFTRKAAAQHKSHWLYKQFRPLLSVRASFFFLSFFLNSVQLIYSILLVSGIQFCVYIYI